MIKAAGKTEMCELLDVDVVLDVGIDFRTCGHFLRDDTTEQEVHLVRSRPLFNSRLLHQER